MLLLRSPLPPKEITTEIYDRFDVVDEAGGIPSPDSITAVATKGDLGLPGEIMAKLPSLKMISVYGVGVDRIDLDQARERGIAIATTPDVLTDAVAEQALALMLASCRRIAEGDRYLRAGGWANGDLDLGYSLKGRTLGVLGYGRIGRRIAEIGRAMGMNVLYTDLSPCAGEEQAFRATPVDLAKDCDIFVVAAAGGAGTRGLVDAPVLEAIGPKGLFVNIARGTVVNEKDLLAALSAGTLGAAALDVFENEPNPNPAFAAFPNVVLTPHLASATIDARLAMGRLVIDNLAAFFEGKPLITPLDLGA